MEPDTRSRILDAAEIMLVQHGLNATTLRMITAEARANLAAVSYHFGSKEALIEAVDRLNRRFVGLDIIFIESGGDNLAATFSPELSDLTLYVIDVAAGDKIPRKGGPGIMKSDLLIINKIDLAPMVGASLEVMATDANRMRGERPFIFSNLKTSQGLAEIIAFIERQGLIRA